MVKQYVSPRSSREEGLLPGEVEGEDFLAFARRLSTELKQSAHELSRQEARMLVDIYYQMQDERIRTHAQIRAEVQNERTRMHEALHESGWDRLSTHAADGRAITVTHSQLHFSGVKPLGDDDLPSSGVVPESVPQLLRSAEAVGVSINKVFSWTYNLMATTERHLATLLGEFAINDPAGAWAQSIVGIGPVISAGLVAHIDMTHCLTAGDLWHVAGLDPTARWEKGQRRPWNARLKVLCAYKLGESFVKVQSREGDVYGHFYRQRKALEMERNDAGLFANQASAILEARRFKPDTAAYLAYTQGKLPPAQIHARARRWAVKLFLSHYQHVAYEAVYHQAPPAPYVFVHQMGHGHYYPPPNHQCVYGVTMLEREPF